MNTLPSNIPLLRLFRALILLFAFGYVLNSCEKEKAEPHLYIRIVADPNQIRLNNLGQASTVKDSNAAFNPVFNSIGLHYIELAQNTNTQLGRGKIIYQTPDTTIAGVKGLDFQKLQLLKNGDRIITIPLKELPKDTFRWLRASVAYQNFDVVFNLVNVPNIGTIPDEKGTIASFVGYNSFITTHKVREKSDTVRGMKRQGYWAFESNLSKPFSRHNLLKTGESAAGATTVVNPLAATSPIPAGSCVVTGEFDKPFVVNATNINNDIYITLSFSVNKSFEWREAQKNGEWDIDAQNIIKEPVVDMGLRGLKVFYSNTF